MKVIDSPAVPSSDWASLWPVQIGQLPDGYKSVHQIAAEVNRNPRTVREALRKSVEAGTVEVLICTIPPSPRPIPVYRIINKTNEKKPLKH